MTTLMLKDCIFISFVITTLIGALGAVTFKKVFHNALSLGLCFFGIAGLYIFLNAEFLAAIQIIVYIGAIAIAIVFAIMLSDPSQSPHPAEKHRTFSAICVSICLFLVLALAIIAPASYITVANIGSTTTATIGRALLSEFIIPFELVSLVLLIALIGALVISKKTKEL